MPYTSKQSKLFKRIDCKTTGGNVPNVECVFPVIGNGIFGENGKTYDHCRLIGYYPDEGYYCSTKVDSSGKHIGGLKNTGICGPECPQGI